MAAKMKDIARVLGISPATVSMAMNNKPGVSHATRERVLQTAQEMGLLDRERGVHHRGNIALLIYRKLGKRVNDTAHYAQLVEGVEMQCRENGYQLFVSYIVDYPVIGTINEDIEQNKAKGAIVLATEMDEHAMDVMAGLAVPSIYVDVNFQGRSVNCITANNAMGAFLATVHLLEHNHQNIGYLAGKVRIGNFKERSCGYNNALRDWGVPCNEQRVVYLGTTLEEAFRDMWNYLKTKPALPTAFFADNDDIALGAVRAFKELGWSVPGDISIVGFGDMPFCSASDPPLTTVAVDKEKIGRLAVHQLLECIKNPLTSGVKCQVHVQLVRRRSVRYV